MKPMKHFQSVLIGLKYKSFNISGTCLLKVDFDDFVDFDENVNSLF